MGVTIPLSERLQWPEVLRGSGVSSPADLPPYARSNLEFIAKAMFEPLRERFGKPLIVIAGGGYRSPETNRAVGGARASQHVEGLALDLVPASREREDFDRLALLIDQLQRNNAIPMGGRGLYKTAAGAWRFCHVDARQTLARWSSGRVDRLEA